MAGSHHIKALRTLYFIRSISARRVLGVGLLLLAAGFILPALYRAELCNPKPTLLLLDRNGEFLAQFEADEQAGYGFWPVERLPPRVVAATLALEDRRFWRHPGVDPLAVVRAAWQNLKSSRRISGASTIAMQVARMQNPGPRTYARKAVEALSAFFLTLRYGREAILRQYLRLVPYGNQIHGIVYAARFYLDKPVEDLSWAEIAFLAAIPQAPSRMNPLSFKGRQLAIARGERILDALFQDGVLSRAEWELARVQIQGLYIPASRRRPSEALHAILHLQELLEAQKPRDPLVRVSLDLELQNRVASFARQALDRWRRRGAGNLAVIVQARKTREVLVWLGSADYFDESRAGAIDYARIKRSAGSTLKPFLYGLALDNDYITPATVLNDLRPVGGIHNADHRFLGSVLPRQALANSRNVPAVSLLKTVGIDESYLLLQRLGLHEGALPARYYGLGLAIGSLPTTLEHLVRAYGILANDGFFAQPVWYAQQPKQPAARMLSSAAARLITLFLSDPQARLPGFPRMGATEYPFPVAVKTGTSQGYRDAWTVAYSTDYLAGVWVGRPDGLPMDGLGGAESAAELVQTILLHLHRDQRAGMADLSFPAPSGYAPRLVCAASGQTLDADCGARFVEWLPQATPPYGDADRERPLIIITSPEDGQRLLRNPAAPPALNTLGLEVVVDAEVRQVLWYVDGQPYRLVGPPFGIRWPLVAGTHTFQARLPYRPGGSPIVTIQVE